MNGDGRQRRRKGFDLSLINRWTITFIFWSNFFILFFSPNLICQAQPGFSSVTHITWKNQWNIPWLQLQRFQITLLFGENRQLYNWKAYVERQFGEAEHPRGTPAPLISFCAEVNVIQGVETYTDYIFRPWISIRHSQPFISIHPRITLWQLSITVQIPERKLNKAFAV